MLAISVREALRDAVAAFGAPRRGAVDLPSPATHEALYAAIRVRLEGVVEAAPCKTAAE